jgi:hypothetical protein
MGAVTLYLEDHDLGDDTQARVAKVVGEWMAAEGARLDREEEG